jgi:hypothetical protein
MNSDRDNRVLPRRIGEDRTRAQGARSVLHASDIDCTKLAGIEPFRRAFHRRLVAAADLGKRLHTLVDQVCIIAAKINVMQPPALGEPVR